MEMLTIESDSQEETDDQKNEISCVWSEETYEMPLWEEKFSKKALLKKLEELGSKRAFERGFNLKVYSDEEKTFPSFPLCKKPIPNTVIDPSWPRFAGVDPFGKNIVIFVIALSPIGVRYPVDIKIKVPRNEIIDTLLNMRVKHNLKMMVVEDNAAQIFIADGVKLKGGKDFPITTKTTSANTKRAGFASLEVEFATGMWCWAMGERAHEYDCSCGWCVWEREMDNHPEYETIDTIIACYYAREAAKLESEDRALLRGYEEIEID